MQARTIWQRFFGQSLLTEWDEDTRLVLLGHSFGGATVRVFAELMAHGTSEECVTEDWSPLFQGGMGDRIHSIVTLASPMNGTTAYDLFEDASFHPEAVRVTQWSRIMARMMAAGTKPRRDARISEDYAGHDMHLDTAAKMNAWMREQKDTFYCSVPCSCTEKKADGTWRPKKEMEPLFVMRLCQNGAYTGVTKGGMTVDETWRENDGLVNTVSASWPTGSEHRPFDPGDIQPGSWNVFPTYEGDHMSLQGGLMRVHDVRGFYEELLCMIAGLYVPHDGQASP